MASYLSVLRQRDYRLLWSGAVLSYLGDGATWTVLSWMATVRSGAAGLGILTVCYTGPVVAGGMLVGPLLDRVSRRAVLIADSVIRGLVIASVPVAAWLGSVPAWQLYAVAALWGVLRIVPLGAVPTVVPDLVDRSQLQVAAALETIGYGTAGIIGPAAGGVLIPVLGDAATLWLVVAAYVAFLCTVLAIRAPLARPGKRAGAGAGASGGASGGWRPVLRLIAADRVLLAITVGFAFFNSAAGMLRVTSPWLADGHLPGGSQTLGLLLSSYSGAQLAGSLVAGMLPPSDRQMLRIGLLQVVAGGSLILLLVRQLPVIVCGLLLCGAFSSPMTVSSQVIRVLQIPAELRGRAMTLMRTVMNGAIPLGSVIAAVFLARASYGALVIVMTTAAALPGVAVAVMFRGTSFAARLAPAPGQHAARPPGPRELSPERSRPPGPPGTPTTR